MEKRKDVRYEVNPWALTWDNENYYLIAYVAAEDMIKHYRVDKMRNIELLDAKRQGLEYFRQFDMASYAKLNFGMFGGEEIRVKLEFRNEIVGVLLDRFGREIQIQKSDREGWSVTNVDVALSDQFYGWIFSLGTKIRIIEPEEVSSRFADEMRLIGRLYE